MLLPLAEIAGGHKNLNLEVTRAMGVIRVIYFSFFLAFIT
jgi:hypothetical protein